MPSCLACASPAMEPHLRPRPPRTGASFAPDTAAYGVALGEIWRCSACGHGQVWPMPAAAELRAAYAAEAVVDGADESAGLRATAAVALARIERALGWGVGDGIGVDGGDGVSGIGVVGGGGAGGALLDLGCWTGEALLEARARGWRRCTGVDPSPAAVAAARSRGLDVVEGAVPGALAEVPGPWDAVVLADVLEHLVEPVAALQAVAEVVRPGGVVWLALPDAGSRVARGLGRRWWSVLPTHVGYFTRGSVRAALGRAGLRVEWLGTAPKAFSVAYYAGRVGGYSPALGRAAVGTVRGAGLGDRLWAPDFRDRMGVLARRL